MDALNNQLTFCVLICQAGTPFLGGTNCAKLWVHFHKPWIAEFLNDFCLLAVSKHSTALELRVPLKRNANHCENKMHEHREPHTRRRQETSTGRAAQQYAARSWDWMSSLKSNVMVAWWCHQNTTECKGDKRRFYDTMIEYPAGTCSKYRLSVQQLLRGHI